MFNKKIIPSFSKKQQLENKIWWIENVDSFMTNRKNYERGFMLFLATAYYLICKKRRGRIRNGVFIPYTDDEKYDFAVNATLRFFERMRRNYEQGKQYAPKPFVTFVGYEVQYQLFGNETIKNETRELLELEYNDDILSDGVIEIEENSEDY